jgi:probable F420-dependent oxidoreductase
MAAWNLGDVGIWSAELRVGELSEARDAAAELEGLGFRAAWIPGRDFDPSAPESVFDRAAALLDATERLVVATGIISLWNHEPAAAAAAHAAITRRFPGRFLLGIGISHAPLVDRDGVQRYGAPVATTAAFLDALDAAPEPVPAHERVLAALGPRMLDLARARSAGTHPYITPVEHTAWARERLGPDALLAPELTVVLDTRPAEARAAARRFLGNPYLGLPNYRAMWLRSGFVEADLDDGGSDALVDRVTAWGDEAAVAGRIAEHRAAGADHVCLRVAIEDAERFPREEWRRLAAALL